MPTPVSRRAKDGFRTSIALVVLASLSFAQTHDDSAENVKPAAIPAAPMGWNSWNSFANLIDSKIAVQQAQAMVDSGMKAAGYQFVVVDEGWWKGARDGAGNIVVDARQWPALKPGQRAGDMSNLAQYIHSLGLKAGIYTDAGKSGCSFAGPDIGPKYPGTGSEDHYDQDFLQFARWGFDYVKVDWCGGAEEKRIGAVQYAEVARAIQKAERTTGHRIYFLICEWGSQNPWNWAPGVGGIVSDIWRTGGDIVAPVVEEAKDEAHLKRTATLKNVLSAFDAGMHPEAQHTGYYNDLDMMVIGMRGMQEDWDRVHKGLRAVSSAPLMVGADLTRLSKSNLALLTNPEVLALHNDPVGVQAIKVAEPGPGLQVWAKPLAKPGERAVVLLNRTESAAAVSVAWAQLGLAPAPAHVRDLFARRDAGRFDAAYTATVPAQDLVMLIVSGQERASVLYTATGGTELIGGAAAEPCRDCPGGRSVTIGGNKALSFRDVRSAKGPVFARVIYRSGARETVVGRLSVNAARSTGVAFPPTGGETRALTLYLSLRGENHPNDLEFTAPCGADVALEAISVSSW